MKKELLKILSEHSDKLNMNKRTLFIQLVEMYYQYINCNCYLSKYRNADYAYTEFFTEYQKQVLNQPFADVLGEVMTELNLLDIGRNTKLCQNLTPIHLSESTIKMLGKFETDNELLKIGDICMGSGALVLSHFKEYLSQNIDNDSVKPIYYLMNDKDSLMCKVAVIQIESNNLSVNKGKVPMLYQVFNHDAITEYKQIILKQSEKSRIVGSSFREEINDKNIVAGLKHFKEQMKQSEGFINHNRLYQNFVNHIVYRNLPQLNPVESSVRSIVQLIKKTARKKNRSPFHVCRDLISALYYYQLNQEIEQEHNYLYDACMELRFTLLEVYKQKPWTDVLGEVLHEIGSLDKSYLGQCLSPYDLNSLISKICMSVRRNEIRRTNKSEISISDPTGSGTAGPLLDLIKTALENEQIKNINVQMIDIDDVMVKAAVIQINYNRVLNNLNEVEIELNPICCNALTMKS